MPNKICKPYWDNGIMNFDEWEVFCEECELINDKLRDKQLPNHKVIEYFRSC